MTEQEIEARRFAIKAQKEKEKAEAAAEAEKMLSGDTSIPKPSKRLGRPDDAQIVGDLANDSLRLALKKAAEEKRKLLMDSLMAHKDSVAIDTSWTKEEYVPVTSFIHNLQFDNNWHTYIAYRSPKNLYTAFLLTEHWAILSTTRQITILSETLLLSDCSKASISMFRWEQRHSSPMSYPITDWRRIASPDIAVI